MNFCWQQQIFISSHEVHIIHQMTIESSLHIFLEIFAYFAQVHVINDDDDVEAKLTFLTSTLLGSVVKLMMRDSTSLVSAELTKSVSFITNTRLCMQFNREAFTQRYAKTDHVSFHFFLRKFQKGIQKDYHKLFAENKIKFT